MPKAPVDKQGYPPAPKDKIPGQIFRMKTVSQSRRVRRPTHPHFRLGVTPRMRDICALLAVSDSFVVDTASLVWFGTRDVLTHRRNVELL